MKVARFRKMWYDGGMKKILAKLMFILTVVVGATALAPGVVWADGGCGNGTGFFGLKPWYDGLTETVNGECEVKTPTDIPGFVSMIVLNIMYDISVMIGYVALVMVAWGGYLYMFSSGSPDRVEKGKKTIVRAIVGLGIAMLASVIMNTISLILTSTS